MKYMDKFMLDDLDEYERRILAILQVDASRSTTDIAQEIGLSQAPCWRRIQRLKDEGYIRAQVCARSSQAGAARADLRAGEAERAWARASG
jgi:Lrp/AsnC family transcriptional regulator